MVDSLIVVWSALLTDPTWDWMLEETNVGMSIEKKSGQMRSHTVRRGRIYASLGTVGALIAGLGISQNAGAATHATTMLANSQPSFVAHAKDLGAVSSSRAVDFEILLGLPDESGVEAEVQALSTPGSASFRKFLTPAEFQSTYSPSPSAVSAVETWVRGGGLKVKSVAPSRLYVEVTGMMGRAEALVGTTLHTYGYRGHELAEPVSNYTIPANLSGTVAGVVNLDDAAFLQKPASSTGDPSTAGSPATTSTTGKPDNTLPGPPKGVHYGIQPCSAYYGQTLATDKPPAYGQTWPYTICGYNADQYEKAFGLYDSIQAGNDGTGVTVAITDAYAAPTILSDADTWSTQNDVAPFKDGQFTQVTPAADGYNNESRCGPQGWYGEETLDVEAVHAMAPGAHIVFVAGKNCGGGLDSAWASTIDNHLASVVTDSWDDNTESLPAGQIAFYHEYLLEAATTGITVMFSSGDDGDEATTTGTKQVGLPASDSYATAVGGTSTEIGQDGSIVFQEGWSNFYSNLSSKGVWTPAPPGTFSSGSGGGTSVVYAQPFYQVGVVPSKISKYNGHAAMRAVPDVAMPADPNTGLDIGETQQFSDGTYYSTYRLGGTSLSSPLFAGVVADAVQFNGAAVGFINPLLYQNIDTSAITDVLQLSGRHATVRTNLTKPGDPTSRLSWVLQTIGLHTTIFAGPGYDDQTGVGTPNGVFFLQAMKYQPS
jgi:subtilase family serine protease